MVSEGFHKKVVDAVSNYERASTDEEQLLKRNRKAALYSQ